MFAKVILGFGALLYLVLLSGTIASLHQFQDSGGPISLYDWIEATVFLPGTLLLFFGAYFLGLRSDWRSNRFGLLGLIALIPIHFVLSAIVSHGEVLELFIAFLLEVALVLVSIILWHKRIRSDESVN